MSADAERYVKSCPVKGSTRALLQAIAELIPEGQTTTPLVSMQTLAAAARIHRVTAFSQLKVLVDHREIKVLDGGQGQIARYQIVHLEGARPLIDAPLPLRADLRPVARPRVEATPDLFDPVVVPAAVVPLVAVDYKWGRQLIANGYKYGRSVRQLVVNGYKYVELVGRTCSQRLQVLVANGYKLLPQGVDDQHARDVHTSKKEHTHTAPRDDAPEPETQKPPPVIQHPWHAWCGRVCVPKALHDDWRRKGYTADWLVAFYTRTCAALPAEQLRRAVDEFKFWRTALAAELAATHANTRAGPQQASPYLRRGCGIHDPPCVRTDECIARRIADGRAERERKSG